MKKDIVSNKLTTILFSFRYNKLVSLLKKPSTYTNMIKLLKFWDNPVPNSNEVRVGDKINIRDIQTKKVFLTDMFIVTNINLEKLEVTLKANYPDGPEVVIPKQDFTKYYGFFQML